MAPLSAACMHSALSKSVSQHVGNSTMCNSMDSLFMYKVAYPFWWLFLFSSVTNFIDSLSTRKLYASSSCEWCGALNKHHTVVCWLWRYWLNLSVVEVSPFQWRTFSLLLLNRSVKQHASCMRHSILLSGVIGTRGPLGKNARTALQGSLPHSTLSLPLLLFVTLSLAHSYLHPLPSPFTVLGI